MVLQEGDRVLLSHRRLFADDSPRFFAGIVDAYEDGIARITGYSWVRDQVRGQILRKEDRRTKIVSIASGTLLVYRLPVFVDIESLRIESGPYREVLLSDGQDFRMDLTDRRQASK